MPPTANEIIHEANTIAGAAADQIDLADALAALAAAAVDARNRAQQARDRAEDARNAAPTNVAGAEHRLTQARACLAESVALTAPVLTQAGVGDPKDHWKECRVTIDRFDKLLVDLRKTGFGFVTALVAAAVFLFNQTTPAIKEGLFCIFVVLIVTMYLIDRVHQVWLLITVEIAQKLEARLKYELTTKISNKFSGWDATALGYWLYIVLLFAMGAIFWEAMPPDEAPTGGHRMVIYGAGAVGIGVMTGVIWREVWEYWNAHRWAALVVVVVAVGLFLNMLAAGLLGLDE